MNTEIPTEHPHIVRKPGTCGGSPIIRGTRIAVRLVAALWNDGESIDNMLQSYPHLKSSWIHDALSYYLDHQAEIDREIQENQAILDGAQGAGGVHPLPGKPPADGQ